MLEVGKKLPEATFVMKTESGIEQITTGELVKWGKIVLVGVPGAFTPTCHQKHLPPFIELASEFKAKGIDCLAVTSVNDIHVMSHWQSQIDGEGKLLFLADGNAEFATKSGMEIDLTNAKMGVRSKRYALIAEGGIIKKLNIEEAAGEAKISSAKELLADCH